MNVDELLLSIDATADRLIEKINSEIKKNDVKVSDEEFKIKQEDKKTRKKIDSKRRILRFVIVGIILTIATASVIWSQVNHNNNCGVPVSVADKWSCVFLNDDLESCDSYSENDHDLTIYLGHEYYNECVNKYKNEGFTICSDKDENRYSAFNEDRFYIDIYNLGTSSRVLIYEPFNFDWPEHDTSESLPTANIGEYIVASYSSDMIDVYKVDSSLKEFKEYRKKCIKSGFTDENCDNDNNYCAYNSNGDRVEISLLNDDVLSIYWHEE